MPQTFKDKVCLCFLSIEEGRSTSVRVDLLHWARAFLEKLFFLMKDARKKRSTLELCWHRQIEDDRGFEFFCALGNDHKCLKPAEEPSDSLYCFSLVLFFLYFYLIFNHMSMEMDPHNGCWVCRIYTSMKSDLSHLPLRLKYSGEESRTLQL